MNKFDPTSHNITDEQRAHLKESFPEAFTEQGIDFDRLKTLLGEVVETDPERYSFIWPGKTEAIRAAQASSMGTLVPDKASSVDWDTTENLYLEGDNLEILKLLQKSYAGIVKMIYIDPPYNTGKDFVYPDKYGEGLKTYLEYTGQIDGEGKRLSTNTETDGRYHSKWLNMMYPRLMLARNLLKDDGVIFVSIDDHEAHNLRRIMDEVFGPENFIAQFVWEKMYTTKNDAAHVSNSHEYVICYCRSNTSLEINLLPRTEEMDARYTNPDKDERGPWKAIPMYARGETRLGRYAIVSPTGKEHFPPSDSHWRYTESDVKDLLDDKKIYFGQGGESQPNLKRFLFEVQQGLIPKTLWFHEDVGSNDSAKREIKELFESPPFDFPKPTSLIKRMLILGTKDEDIVLDFFSGSATTAHAVLSLNAEIGGNRKFILTQIQESTPEGSEARNGGFENITQIGKERIRRAGVKIREEYAEKIATREEPLDAGFKAYRLVPSTFNVWDVKSDDSLQQKLLEATSLIKGDAKEENILTELILKSGYGLTEKVEQLTLGGKRIYSVAGGALIISLETGLSLELVRQIAERKPAQFIAREHGFASDDVLTNTAQIMKDKGIDFRVL